MTDKWNKLRILTNWLEQGRTLELEGVSYGITENGDILHMYCEDKGVLLPSLTQVWSLIDKLDDDKVFIMSSEVAMTNMNKEKAEKRVK